MRKLMRPILILLAIIFLIEAWLWDRLEPIVAWIVRPDPAGAHQGQRSRDWIDRTCRRAGTLVVFVVPLVLAVPFKLFGLWLLANGDLSAALGVLIAAKFITLAITAFVFDVTRDKLLQLDWFRVFYEYVMLLRASAEALDRSDQAPHPPAHAAADAAAGRNAHSACWCAFAAACMCRNRRNSGRLLMRQMQ